MNLFILNHSEKRMRFWISCIICILMPYKLLIIFPNPQCTDFGDEEQIFLCFTPGRNASTMSSNRIPNVGTNLANCVYLSAVFPYLQMLYEFKEVLQWIKSCLLILKDQCTGLPFQCLASTQSSSKTCWLVYSLIRCISSCSNSL